MRPGRSWPVGIKRTTFRPATSKGVEDGQSLPESAHDLSRLSEVTKRNVRGLVHVLRPCSKRPRLTVPQDRALREVPTARRCIQTMEAERQ